MRIFILGVFCVDSNSTHERVFLLLLALVFNHHREPKVAALGFVSGLNRSIHFFCIWVAYEYAYLTCCYSLF